MTAFEEVVAWVTIATDTNWGNTPDPTKLVQKAVDEALLAASRRVRDRFHAVYKDAGQKTAEGLLLAATIVYNQCDETTVYWPDDEAIDVDCILRNGHDGNHEDHDGDWTTD